MLVLILHLLAACTMEQYPAKLLLLGLNKLHQMWHNQIFIKWSVDAAAPQRLDAAAEL